MRLVIWITSLVATLVISSPGITVAITYTSPSQPTTMPTQSSQQPAAKPTPATPAPTTSTPKPSSPSSPTSTTHLPNTGPGNVVAIFVGSTLVAASLHFIVSLRRDKHPGSASP